MSTATLHHEADHHVKPENRITFDVVADKLLQSLGDITHLSLKHHSYPQPICRYGRQNFAQLTKR